MIGWLHSRASNLSRSRFVTRPRCGQAVIMFALMAVPMIGMLGLAVDGGLYLYARRTTQAAADAAALAGARQLSKSIAAQTDVEAVTTENGQGSINPSVQECRYVDDSNTPIGSGTTCGVPPPAASGVLVRTQETVPTFFIGVLPGAPTSTVTTATAIARVQVASGIKADGPFVVCGYDSWDVTDDPNTNNGGTTTSILIQDSPLTFNPDAIDKTFRIWDSRLAQEGANCDEGRQFKGLAESEQNENRSVPGWLMLDNGTQAGPVRSDVSGSGGCEAGMTTFDGCVLILPLTVPREGGASNEAYGVGFAAFRMSPVGSNAYNATLLSDYILSAPGSDGWTAAVGGLVSIRLAG